MKQRANIEERYEVLYGALAGIVAEGVTQSSDPAKVTYGRLKVGVPAAAVTINWARQRGWRPTAEEHTAYAIEYLNEPAEWTIAGEHRTGTRVDYLGAIDALFARTFAERLQGCDLVLDLGCGWGHRMVDVYLQGVNAHFIGGDRSAHSGSMIRSLSGLFPAARLDWFRFDYLNPDFSALPGSFKKIGVFTCHAIEQIEVLGTAVFDALFDRFPSAEISGVHIEPIAWQIEPSRTAARAYAQGLQYNTDLLSIVQAHPSLRVTEVTPVIHDGHDHNPSSLLTWTRAK